MPTSRFIDLLITARWPLLAVAIVLAGLAWQPARQVRFDRSVENMFAPDDPLLAPYQRLKSDFGGNEIVMAVYEDDYLFAPGGSGIERLAEISQRLKEVEGVKDVLSLAQVNELLKKLQAGKKAASLFNLFGSKKEDPFTGPPILHPTDPLAARYRDLFSGYTHSTDGHTAAVVCMLEPVLLPSPLVGEGPGVRGEPPPNPAHQDPRRATIHQLETVMRKPAAGIRPGVLAGEPVMVSSGFALLEQDGLRLGIWSTVLLGLTILVCFRSLRWLLVPIAVVQWALLLTQATLVWSGLRLSMVSSMLTAIVTVVGVATVMHLIVRFRELRAAGRTPRESLQQAGVLLAWPILGAIATDVAGFGSLWWASVGPVQDFGTMMVVGSILVIPAVCLLVPAIALAGSRDAPASTGRTDQGWLAGLLAQSITAINARPKTVAAVSLVVAGIAALGALRLEVESDFTRNFRPGSDVVEAYQFVETRLGGAGVWDVILPAPATLDKEYLARVRRLQERLREIGGQGTEDRGQRTEERGLTKVISLVDALDAVDVDPTLAALTPTPELRAQGLAAAMPTFMAALRKTELDEQGQGRLRIMLRARERQPAEQKRALITEVTRIVGEEFPPGSSHAPRDDTPHAEREADHGAEVTGFFVLLTNLIESMLRDQWTTFAIATAGIFLMILVSFRSLKLALIGLVPNALPIFVVMGLLGWLGLKINMGAAMIAAVSMGLSVDSSIHYFASFRRERRAGQSVAAALTSVQQSVGQAMIFSTIALIVGFSVLCTSDFVPTIYFGALVSLAMLGGLFGNLVILPLLLPWAEHQPDA